MSKTIKLEGAALETARRIADLQKETMAERDRLQKEYNERMEALGAAHNEQAKAHWTVLHMEAGLPVSEVGAWGLDARYLEQHGTAFLEKQDRCSLCGGNHGEDDDDAPASVASDLLQRLGLGGGMKH